MTLSLSETHRPFQGIRRFDALPIAAAEGAKLLSSAEGAPIWPVANDDVRASLARMAELFDSFVVVAQPHGEGGVEHPRCGPRDERFVVSATPDADEVAALYAHLTGRRFRAAAEHSRGGAEPPAVIVAPCSALTPDFLRETYSDPEWAPGLITAETPEALLRQALLRAAAVCLSGRVPRRRTDVRPFAEFECVEEDGREVLGRLAGVAQLKQAMGSGSGLLTIHTVGDGIDAMLGPVILCPMQQLPLRSDGARPPCVAEGLCHRIGVPFVEATAREEIVAPEALAAQVLLFHACWGIQPAGSMYGPMWGYGYRLANHDRLGAMLATWQISVGAPVDTAQFECDLDGGVPLGRALAVFNRSAPAQRTGQLMCLLGDPEMRLPARGRAAAGRTVVPREGTSPEDQRQLSFLAAYLDTIGSKSSTHTAQAEARRAVALCQQRAWRGLAIDAPDEPAGSAMRATMLAFLCAHGTIPAFHWMEMGFPMSATETGERCHACGQSDREVSVRLRVAGAGSRKLVLCPRCGLTGDRPATWPRCGLVRNAKTVEASMTSPPDAWAGRLLLRTYTGTPRSRPWLAAADGRPLRSMQIGERKKLKGTGQLLLFMMSGASLYVMRTHCEPIV
jgi:hypothetical protein